MLQTHPIDQIIRQVEKGTIAKLETEKLLIVERKKSEIRIHQKQPLFSSLIGGSFTHYIVANDKDASNKAEYKGLICTIDNFSSTVDQRIDIAITYQATCSAGQEEKVLEALGISGSPGKELDRRIKKCVAEYSKEQAARFFKNYQGEIARLCSEIQDKIEDEVGLNLRVRIRLAQEDELKSYAIPPFSFMVRVKDSDDEFDLQLATELLIDEVNKIEAILSSGRLPLVVNLIKDEVRKYLRQNISRSNFYAELETSVRGQLIDHLMPLLVQYGRQINYLTLKSSAIADAPEEFTEIERSVDCEIQDPEPIAFKISNILQLKPENIAKYRMSKVPNLSQWVQEKLNQIIKEELFGKQYIDVVLEFNAIANRIRAAMEVAALEIGYSVKQIVSIPKLEEIELTKEFDSKILEGEFSLKDPNVKVKLNIISRLRIKDLRGIADIISPNIKVKDLIERAINDTTGHFLNSVEPERFYMRFSDPDRASESRSIEEELQAAIKLRLEREFKAQVSSSIIKTLDTDIKLCYEGLYKQIGSFSYDVTPLKGGETVRIRGDFQINGVDQVGWYTFQSRQPQLEDIQQCIQKALDASLSNLPSEVLRYNNIQTQRQMQKLVEEIVTESVVKQFGLKIVISNVARDITEVERLRSETQSELEKSKIKGAKASIDTRNQEIEVQVELARLGSKSTYDDLQSLYEQRNRIIANDENEDELEGLNQKIEKLEKKAVSPSLSNAENLLAQLQPSDSDVTNLLNFGKHLSLGSAEDSNSEQDNLPNE
jgi:hypothetical protein